MLAAPLPLVLAAFAVAPDPAAQPAFAAGASSARPRHVVLIGVDGLSPEGIDLANTPVLNRLIAEGARTFTARAVLPTSSSPNWASMIMGAGPAQHGITSNDWERDAHTIRPSATGVEEIFPSIFSLLRAQRPDAYVASIYDWDGFGRLYERSAVDLDHDAHGPVDAVDTAVVCFRASRPTFTFIHLDHVDGAGHLHGWSTPPYLLAVEQADALIGRILGGLRNAGMADDTVLIISSDHGGLGRGHGGETMDELEIPWLIHGPGIARGRLLRAPVNTYDTAATIAHLLGLNMPPEWTARPVVEALAAHPAGSAASDPYIPRPAIYPLGGLFTQGVPPVTIESDAEGATIRYTLDGTDPTLASPIYSSPITIDRTRTLRAAAFTPDGRGDVSTVSYRVVDPDPSKGVRFALYRPALRGFLPELAGLTPVEEGTVPEFALIGPLASTEPMAVRFTGVIEIPVAGNYLFATLSDDGSRLLIDGKPVVDNDGSHGPRLRSGKVLLQPGTHDILVEYFNGGGGSMLEVYLQSPGQPRRIISADELRPK